MACQSYKAVAPGALMLFGEHAVLHGREAIVAAINHYLQVKLTPRSDQNIFLTSNQFVTYQLSLKELKKIKIVKPYTYVLTTIKEYLPHLKSGFDLEINSEFPATIGFGSSAAVTAATVMVLERWLGQAPLSLMRIFKRGLKVIRLVQGVGSGADLAAAVFGGVIHYRLSPLMIKPLAVKLPLVAVYSGKKVPTVEVINKVDKKRQQFSKIFVSLDEALERCTKEAVLAMQQKNWSKLGSLMNIHQGLQDALGVSDQILSEIIFSLRHHSKIYGAKISGAGLGDMVIALGKLSSPIFPENDLQQAGGVREIKIKVSFSGVSD